MLELHLGLGPGLAGGLGVRAKEPVEQARVEEAGARGPPRRSQAASRPLIQNSFGMNWGVPASLPQPTHRFLPGRPLIRVGSTARTRDPTVCTPGLYSHSSLPPWPSSGQEGDSLGGPGGGTALLPHPPGLDLPAAAAALRGWGGVGLSKAKPAWTGQPKLSPEGNRVQPSPTPSSSTRYTWHPFSGSQDGLPGENG